MFLVFLTGCATTKVDNLDIFVTPSGVIKVMGRDTELAKVAKAVRKAGADKGTMILIRITEDTSNQLKKELIHNLSKDGFTQLIFRKALQPSASVKTPSAPYAPTRRR